MAAACHHIRIAGLAAAVPALRKAKEDVVRCYGEGGAEKLIGAIGVERRHIASEKQCTSDLCYAAAEKLFAKGQFDKAGIDAVIFISQTPDYVLPATACILQAKLGLSKNSVAFDINLGCSGYTYGLWQATNMIAAGTIKRVLLLVGDTISKLLDEEDRATYPLFGDAGTATIVEHAEAAAAMSFVWGTDGTGGERLMVPGGGFRSVAQPRLLSMDGAEVFAFSIREIPKAFKQLLEMTRQSIDDLDAVIFHQANHYMLKFLAKKLQIPVEKFIVNIADFGNTSSASIPLALVTELRGRLLAQRQNIAMAGFGVGWSWCLANMVIDPDIIIPELVTVEG